MTRQQRVLKSSQSPSSDELVLLAIPPDEVERVWEMIEPMLAKAMARTKKVDIEDVQEMCEGGYFQLWVVWNPVEKVALAGILTDIQAYYTGRKAARVIGAGGEGAKLWRHLLADIEKWAIEEGCDSIELVGRRGWGRLFPAYAPIEWVYSKELSHGQHWKQ